MIFKIAVLGPIPRDFITTYKNQTIVRYGAITHTVIALAKLIGNKGKVIPVSHIRKDFKSIKESFLTFPNSHISHVDDKIILTRGDVIRLCKFIDQNNRLEKQTGFMYPIRPQDVEDLLDCDMFIILPVSYFEVSLETLTFIKKNSKATISYLMHTVRHALSLLVETVFCVLG